MVRPLTVAFWRWRLPTPVASGLLAGLLAVSHAVATETWISLDQGANLSVTAPTVFDRMVFDLAGQIWLAREGNDAAVALTKPGELSRRPALSRDGQFVAYESVVSGHRQIFVTEIDGGATRQVTFGQYDHTEPAWSSAKPSSLVMSSNRGGTFDIWEVDINSLDLHQLTFARDNEREPAWNDDGSQLAFVTESGSGSALFLLEPGNEPQRVLRENDQIAAPAWRPGGGVLTYTRLKAESNQLRMLILSKPPITKPITQRERVSPRPAHWLGRNDFLYAADGKIRRRMLGLPTFDDIPFRVTIEIKRNSRAARDATAASYENRSVRGINGWTTRADGRTVVAALGDLWEFQREVDGKLKLLRQLTNDAYIDTRPVFSPGGKQLGFVSDRRGASRAWIMDHESLKLRPATLGDDADRWTTGTVANDHPATMTREDPIAVPLSWKPAVSGQRYIVRAGRIFDGIGPGYLVQHEIVIEHDLIVAVRPWSDDEPDTPIINASSHTVIPGLIDLTVQQEPIDYERFGREWLAAGITTIRTTITDLNAAIERLESWGSARRIGPRFMMTVRPCRREDGGIDESSFRQVLADAAALNIAAVELCPDLAGEAVTDMIERAHQSGLSVIAINPASGISLGVDELRTGVPASQNDARTMPAAWHDLLVLAAATGAAVPSGFAVRNADPNQILGAGGRIIIGSEIQLAPRGRSLHAEMRGLAKRGVQPFQILKIASLDAARLLGSEDSLGLVRPGRQADLAILDGDPLANIADAVNVVGTIIRGRYYSRRDLATPGLRGSSQKMH